MEAVILAPDFKITATKKTPKRQTLPVYVYNIAHLQKDPFSTALVLAQLKFGPGYQIITMKPEAVTTCAIGML